MWALAGLAVVDSVTNTPLCVLWGPGPGVELLGGRSDTSSASGVLTVSQSDCFDVWGDLHLHIAHESLAFPTTSPSPCLSQVPQSSSALPPVLAPLGLQSCCWLLPALSCLSVLKTPSGPWESPAEPRGENGKPRLRLRPEQLFPTKSHRVGSPQGDPWDSAALAFGPPQEGL